MSSLLRLRGEGCTSGYLGVIKPKWNAGGCDGGPDGWSRVEVDQVFHTASDSIAQIDAAMTRQQWRPRPPKGGSAVREYEPAEDTYGGYEWLYASDDGSGTKWELDVAADPADNPADSC